MKAVALALLLLAPVAHCQSLPPLPDSVPSVLGYVRVEKVAGLRCGGVEAFGCYNPLTRLIQVRDSMSLVTSWQTAMHEQGHAWLHDMNIHLDRDAENAVVDAMATARLAVWLEERKRKR